MTTKVILLSSLWVVCGGVSTVIAAAKGRPVGWFALLGLILGVIGVIWAACTPSSADVATRRRELRNGKGGLT